MEQERNAIVVFEDCLGPPNEKTAGLSAGGFGKSAFLNAKLAGIKTVELGPIER